MLKNNAETVLQPWYSVTCNKRLPSLYKKCHPLSAFQTFPLFTWSSIISAPSASSHCLLLPFFFQKSYMHIVLIYSCPEIHSSFHVCLVLCHLTTSKTVLIKSSNDLQTVTSCGHMMIWHFEILGVCVCAHYFLFSLPFLGLRIFKTSFLYLMLPGSIVLIDR